MEPNLTPRDRIDILLEEYRAVYGLVTLRLGSLEQRAAIAAASLVAFLTGFAEIDDDGRRALVVGMPLVMLWLIQTTIAHCKAFEDGVRAIEQLELLVNRIAGETLLAFQSHHPSRNQIGGRTGRQIVAAVCLTALAVLCGSVYLAWRHALFVPEGFVAYLGYVAAISTGAVVSLVRFLRYRYRRAPLSKSSSSAPPSA